MTPDLWPALASGRKQPLVRSNLHWHASQRQQNAQSSGCRIRGYVPSEGSLAEGPDAAERRAGAVSSRRALAVRRGH
jgi:hypothetical protein